MESSVAPQNLGALMRATRGTFGGLDIRQLPMSYCVGRLVVDNKKFKPQSREPIHVLFNRQPTCFVNWNKMM